MLQFPVTPLADPPEVRKAAAEETIRKVEREISVWTDGSSVEGIGGGGGIILVGNSEQEIRQPAGKFCSSTKAELVAVAAALKRIGLDEDRTMAIFSDSRAAIQALQAGPLRQRTPVSHEIWNELLRLQGQGCQVTFHWVPGHADIDLNERADRLANEARALPNADDILTMTVSALRPDLPSRTCSVRGRDADRTQVGWKGVTGGRDVRYPS